MRDFEQIKKARAAKAADLAFWAKLPAETRKLIIAGGGDCPLCHGSEFVCGVFSYNCACQGFKIFHSQFAKFVPENYRHMAGELQPSEKSVASRAFQQQVIDLLKLKPTASFAFYGSPGCGKTALSIWLFIRALRAQWVLDDGTSAYRASGSALVRQHVAYITDDEGNVPEPDVTVEKIKRALRPCVYLSEMEKIGSMTDYKYEVLFTVLDALYERCPGVQVVVDSNMTLDEFEVFFTSKISRRVAELCYTVHYFDEKILPPTEEKMR